MPALPPCLSAIRYPLSEDGFTLIELLVVVTIITLVTLFAMPSVSSYFQVSINSATRELATTVKEAYNATVLTGRVYRLVYDFKENTYWVESGPPNVLLDTEASLEKAKRRERYLRPGDAPPASPFGIDKSVTRKHEELPRGVIYEDILTQASKDPLTEGTAYTHFFPHGITEQTIIHLKDQQNHHVSLVISPLIGATDVYDRYVRGEEVFAK
jgi:prepilin-type N-terminal cleavage/methylation domain-containing protein